MTFDIQKSGSIRAPGDSHFGKFSPVRLAKCNRTILALSYWMTDNFAQLGPVPTLLTGHPISLIGWQIRRNFETTISPRLKSGWSQRSHDTFYLRQLWTERGATQDRVLRWNRPTLPSEVLWLSEQLRSFPGDRLRPSQLISLITTINEENFVLFDVSVSSQGLFIQRSILFLLRTATFRYKTLIWDLR